MSDRAAFAVARRVVTLIAALFVVTLGWLLAERWGRKPRPTEDAVIAHSWSIAELTPGGTYRLASFPVPEGQDSHTFEVRLNQLRWRERDVSASPAPGRRRVVLIGDSITYGTGVAEHERFGDLLAARLEQAMPGCCEVVNAGLPGRDAEDAVRALRKSVLPLAPSVVVVGVMANDARQRQTNKLGTGEAVTATFEAHLRALESECRERGVRVVFWGNTLIPGGQNNALRPFCDSMAAVARDTGSTYIDLDAVYAQSPATADEINETLDAEDHWLTYWDNDSGAPPERTALHLDWVHPSRAGHRRLAEALAPVVLRELRRQSSTQAPRPTP